MEGYVPTQHIVLYDPIDNVYAALDFKGRIKAATLDEAIVFDERDNMDLHRQFYSMLSNHDFVLRNIQI